ncbi:MAG: hypothetical protein HKO66_07990 [Saprospiraceae bacterium]|nr:hypothetical protein [Bacteroidia bacterium]NNE15239.1 hypothetical protein [Saprospiraceae bacterium]NNL92157.1 hypothetical protein [Saprospiraceae bacterium]
MLRRIGAVICGFLVGFALYILIQRQIALQFPPEFEINAHDKEALTRYFRSLPDKFFIYILLAQALTALFASFVTTKIADKYNLYMGLLVGGMFFIASISFIATVPTPGWMLIAAPISIIIAVYFGTKFGLRK